MKQLPIGIQSFEKLRTSDLLYVDKTEIIHRLISTGNIYFLSRPRRFGKSLLISTMEALFKGKKELFEGLYIYDKWDWSQQYPVIRIDWTQLDHSTPGKIETNMIGYLKEIAQNYQVTLSAQTAPDCLRELITLLYKTTGQRVVVLIDEYDKPITSHLFNPLLDATRTAVHNLYQVIKGADEYLRFVFLTGVSKFSGMSIFSALNNLNDITLHWNYVAICGYTQEELEHYFADYIDEVAEYKDMSKNELLEEIKKWYNGYSWDGKTPVYNPFSTLLFFNNKEFDNYWFRTGTPTFLIELLKKRNQLIPIL
ncbi:MAG: AAA family ATPase, partial [Dysgonamonadaceae bacterium]|nr:AAA family ATPase [Dysgonamonadaceae bacterium]